MDQAATLPRKHPPLAAHRGFAIIVALWCAAVLGLSSLALAPAVLERLVAATQLDRLLPAAAPPLGQTARLALALGLAALGGLIGWAFGARLSARARRARAPFEAATIDEPPHLRARDRHPDAPARWPLSASSELDLEDPVVADPVAPEPLAAPVRRAPSPLAAASLDSLGLAQLTERLAIAMCERFARTPSTERDAPVEHDEPIAFPSLAARSRG